MSKAELCNKCDLPVAIHGVELILLADRGVFWPERKLLFVADTHFGKEASFQRQGLAVPRCGMTETLHALERMLAATQASELVVLGDLFHARCSFIDEVRSEFEGFLRRHRGLNWLLVEGNHDVQSGRLPSEWNIEVVQPGYRLGDVVLHHQPIPMSDPPDGAAVLQLCGHLHPALQVGSRREKVGRFPCFWLTEQRLVLPALGTFTGCLSVQPTADDTAWVIAEDCVLQVK